MENRSIGVAIRCLDHHIGRAVSTAAAREFGDSATGTHGWVLRYLYEHRDREIFQKDLETRFAVRRSTMTSILQLMEKNGLIKREPVSRDARLKRLVLTPAAIEIQDKIRGQIDDLEDRMRSGIPEEELAAFFAVIDRIRSNLPEDSAPPGGKPPLAPSPQRKESRL